MDWLPETPPPADCSLVALDIETTGLDPRTDRVRAVALATSSEIVAIEDEDESSLLEQLEKVMVSLPRESLILSWNGEEFDFPFLASRYRINGVETSLAVTPTRSLGKYGKPRSVATWGRLKHVDLAFRYRQVAQRLGVQWSLKPLSKVLLGVDPVEVDRSGASIAEMDRAPLLEYVSSDASITLALGLRARPRA